MDNAFDWVDKEEERKKEARSNDYFDIEEGANRFFLLSHFGQLAQVFEGGKYRPAVEGDDPSKISTKGVCWILQDGHIKEAKMPYLFVKWVRALRNDPDWEFTFPFPHQLTLNAEGAGTKEIKYSFTASPKKTEFSKEILDELARKATPEERVERLKGGAPVSKTDGPVGYEYPAEEIDPADIPFD